MNTCANPARVAGVSVLLAILALGSGLASAIQDPVMVKDVNAGTPSSDPVKFLPLAGKLFFVANNGTTGLEPWVSDGTLGGTSLLRDIWSGANSSFASGCPTCNAISLGPVVYFSASNGVGGSQLWRSDGTVAGTVNVYPDASASTLTAFGGDILFAGVPSGNSVAFLYRSDGTTVGTNRVTSSTYLAGTEMTVVSGTAFFPADDGASGSELWRSDGSAVGTSLVKNLAPGSSSSYPTRLTNVGGILYFTANDGTAPGLFRSDGTEAGTVLVKTLMMPADYTTPGQLIDGNGQAFLIATDAGHGAELWRSDGTTAGTEMVKDIYPGNVGGLSESYLVAIGNVVYFAANDAVHGIELWRSDGTAGGTVMVKDIDPQADPFSSSSPAGLANVDGTLYFRARSSNLEGTQPWLSDGTESGTVQIATLYPAGNSLASFFTGVNGSIYFSATDGAHGNELWAMLAGVIGVDPEDDQTLPRSVSLAQNFPNPFNPRTVIAFDLPTSARVSLCVFDVSGKLLRTLVHGATLDEGHHETAWDGRDESGVMAAAGVYMYRLETGDQTESKAMLLVK
jgi:ELWxxDGT repeat protein